jgi:hypothetical protein
MGQSSYRGLLIFVVTALLWGAFALKNDPGSRHSVSEARRRSPVQGENTLASPKASEKLAMRDVLGVKVFDIQNFDSGQKSSSKENKSVHRSLKEMQRLLRCFESENCNFDQSTSQTYHIAVRENLMLELQTFKSIVESQNYSDPILLKRAAEITEFFLLFPDDDIKEQALFLAHVLPASNEICDQILLSMSESVSAEFHASAMKEILRYNHSSEKARIDETIAEILRSGSSVTARQAARNLYPLITAENVPKFMQVMNDLPRRSLEFEMLRAQLNEFSRQQKGG